MQSRKSAMCKLLIALWLCLMTGITEAQVEITFPDLSGPYQVGKMEYHLTDEAHDEIFTEDPDDKRELMTMVYYPGQPEASAATAPYTNEILADAFGISPDLLDQIHPHA